jgi:hypothetical protein
MGSIVPLALKEKAPVGLEPTLPRLKLFLLTVEGSCSESSCVYWLFYCSRVWLFLPVP